MREIIFDTETTGLDIALDRIIEIGCVELVNRVPTGQRYQRYLNPDRAIPYEAFRVHGLSDQFLASHPRFPEVVDEFLAFVGDAPLVAHNAEFDLSFINAELARAGRPRLDGGRVVDSLALARSRFPVGPNNLDALCQRFGVDLGKRTVHGALIDASLLAEVYIELTGGRQASLVLGDILPGGMRAMPVLSRPPARQRPVPRTLVLSADEIAAHGRLVAALGAGAVWGKFGLGAPAAVAS